MKKYFINLDSRTDRLHGMLSNEYSKHFTRVNAIHFDEISNDYLTPNGFKLQPAETACFLSHLRTWGIVATDEEIGHREFVMICEDDISIINDPDLVIDLIEKSKHRFVQCANRTIDSFKVLTKNARDIDRTSSACYFIRKDLCKELYNRYKDTNIVCIADLFSSYIDEHVGELQGIIAIFNEHADKSDISPQTDLALKKYLKHIGIKLDTWLI